MSKLRKRLLWSSLTLLVLAAAEHGVSRMLPDRVLPVRNSTTTESLLMFGSGGVGFVTVSDPSGRAIPFSSRWTEVVDPDSRRELASTNVRLVFRSGTTTYVNRQGGVVTLRMWYVIYLPLAALAALVVIANAFAWIVGRARASAVALRAWRRQRIHPAGEHCPACGYDVRESADRCPECGQAFVRRTVIVAASRN
jgi:hypothetical protein